MIEKEGYQRKEKKRKGVHGKGIKRKEESKEVEERNEH